MFVSSYIVKKYYQYRKKHLLPTIKRIPDIVWNEVKHILPKEKPRNTKGHLAVPFRKVLDGILFVLRTGCQWKTLPREYGSGSITCHRGFQQWVKMDEHIPETMG
jgi:transposase